VSAVVALGREPQRPVADHVIFSAGLDALAKVSAIVGNRTSVVQPLVRHHTERAPQDHISCFSDSKFEIIHKVPIMKNSQHCTPRAKVYF